METIFRSAWIYFSGGAWIAWKHFLTIVWLLYGVSIRLRGFLEHILAFVTYFIDYGFLGASWGSSVLVELHVDGMQFYQQSNLLRLYRTDFCGGVYFQ